MRRGLGPCGRVMPERLRLLPALAVLWMAAACQLAAPGGSEGASPLAAEAIGVTALPMPGAPAGATAAEPDRRGATATQTVPAPAPASAPSPTAPSPTTPSPTAPPPAAEAASPAPPAEPAAVAAPLTPEARACQRRGGTLTRVGRSGLTACVTPTRDSGKQCRRATDCEGECLARSGSCAPVTPLFGCNEVLQADGRRFTQCLQ